MAGAIAAMTVGYVLDDYDVPIAKPRAVISLRGRLFPLESGASPFHAGDPPLLVFHGDADERIDIKAADAMFRRASEAGVPVRFLVAPGVGHELGGAGLLSMETHEGNSVLEVMDAFLTAAFENESRLETDREMLIP